ncbi:hypothetical protein AB1Y20_019107 [Prymnesium parvum]|uniref:Uncharacterized protein n=1 Tax=Prymnesium parvum TaxID=97485 RepID=A0AB34JJ39_PRYPA
MPRVLLATDDEGNARVFTVPSPTREGVDDECPPAQDAGPATGQVSSAVAELAQSSGVEDVRARGGTEVHESTLVTASAATATWPADLAGERRMDEEAKASPDIVEEVREEGRSDEAGSSAVVDGFVLVQKADAGVEADDSHRCDAGVPVVSEVEVVEPQKALPRKRRASFRAEAALHDK